MTPRERVSRVDVAEEPLDNQVESLWLIPVQKLLGRGLPWEEAIATLTGGQHAFRLLLEAQGAINNGGAMHFWEHEELHTPALVEAARQVGAGDFAEFFERLLVALPLLEEDTVLEAALTDEFHVLAAGQGEFLYALTPLLLAYVEAHPDDFYRD